MLRKFTESMRERVQMFVAEMGLDLWWLSLHSS